MSSKDVGLRIRVERELREAFQGACLAENRNASEVLREFMQAFADKHQGGLQPDMSRRLAAGYVKAACSRICSQRRQPERCKNKWFENQTNTRPRKWVNSTLIPRESHERQNNFHRKTGGQASPSR